MELRDFYMVLGKRIGFEVKAETVSSSQMRLVGRIPQANMANWLVIMQRLLLRADKSPWKVDISKQYFLSSGKVLFGWRLIFQGEGIAGYLSEISQTVDGAPKARVEIDEVPLHASPSRNALVRGKGAQGVLTAVVGPLAAQKSNMGS